MARRTTHRSSRGTDLYAVADGLGGFKRIQTYKRVAPTATGTRMAKRRFELGAYAARMGEPESACPYRRASTRLDWLKGYRSVKDEK